MRGFFARRHSAARFRTEKHGAKKIRRKGETPEFSPRNPRNYSQGSGSNVAAVACPRLSDGSRFMLSLYSALAIGEACQRVSVLLIDRRLMLAQLCAALATLPPQSPTVLSVVTSFRVSLRSLGNVFRRRRGAVTAQA